MKTNLRYNSRKPHLLPLREAGRAFIFLCLTLASVGAWATDYVFVYNGNYLGVNAAGTGIANYTTFDPERCVWTCMNGNNEATLGGTSYALRITYNGNTRYLTSSATNGAAPSLATTAQNVWRGNDTYVWYRNNGNNTYYLYYRGGSWRTSNQGSPRATAYNDNSYYRGYALTDAARPDYRATQTASSTTGATDGTTAPTISYGSRTATTITLSRTNLTGTYTPAATAIVVGGTTYYKGTGANGAYSTTAPSATLNPTYTWSVTSGNASITQAGVVTPNNNITNNITVRLTTTNANPALTKTTDYTINVSSIAAATTYSGGLNAVNPANSTLTYNANTSITLDSPARKKNTKAAYQTYTASGNTFYRVNNNFQAAAPTATSTDVAVSSYSWALSGAGASNAQLASATGTTNTLTYNSAAENDVTVTINVTANYTEGGNISKSANVTLREHHNDPTSVSATDMIVDAGENRTITPTVTPADAYKSFEFSSANASIATVNTTTGVVTGVAGGETSVTIKAYKFSAPAQFVQTTITVTVMEKVATPVIEFTPQGEGETASTTITCTTPGATIYYTTDGTTPSASSTAYTGTFTVNNLDVVKAIAIKDGTYFTDSEVASATYSKHKMPTPTINIDGSGVSFTCSEAGATFYYTTDGSTPTTSSTLWNGTPFTPSANECTIKVIAVKAGSQNSDVAERPYVRASGVSGGTVYLNDYEDHTWTYYAGVNPEVDGGHYNTTYRAQGTTSPKYDAKIYSPNPRNVKITYNATNSAAVSLTESENSFVYYKTLEQGTTEGQYPYQVISNPFSKRPAHSGTTYYGFAGWKVTRGYEYMRHANGTAVTKDEVLALDESIYFTELPYPSVNCTSAEIVFETTWTTANRTYISTNPGSNQTYTFNSGSYETNFIVINVNYTRQITISGSATIMMVEPDGSDDYRTRAYSGALVPATGAANTTKIEFANWTATGTRDAYGRNLTIGRGMTMSTARDVVGSAQTGACNQVLKIESGNYGTFYHFTATPSSLTKQWITFGNDYDRAKKDWEGNNNTLNFSGQMRGAASRDVGKGSTEEMWRVVAKSGKYLTGVGGPQDAAAEQSYYIGVSGTHNNGHRYLEIQGGHWAGNISGGMGENHTPAEPAFTFRMRGGHIVGSIYGAAQYAGAGGGRTYIITGGEINGWVAAGANGTQSSGGLNAGASYVYVGGNAVVDSKHSTTLINRSVGGNVYGAGCGYSASSNSGEMTLGSNMVVADNAYIERGLYGGGAYGFVTNTQTSYIYITGGHVGGYTGQDYGSTTIQGGVYGGARQNKGGSAIIYMTGGLVETGIYGGSNNSGTMNGSVTMQINGGQVGTSTTPGNIHGGGYGQNTIINQNVDITLGKMGAARDADGVTVWGDVYGGSALGSVNGTAASNTKHTNVTMNAGYIHGSLYGGALGQKNGVNGATSDIAANVYGPVAVTVNGGSVMNTDGTGSNGSGAVYGANNINGAPQRSVTVDIYGTNSAPAEGEYALFSVYGGGNQANYTYGNGYPKVTVHNCDNSIEYVYGGGNAAAVAATDVTIYGGNKIGNVFGGGNGQVRAANVTGGTNVKIYGGTIGDVYGGSNTNGTIGGTISVTVNKTAEDGGDGCDMKIDNVYGGGNHAPSAAGSITIGCTGDAEEEGIGNVYGGANAANISSSITLNITGGKIDNVFGGNNADGVISGDVTVNITGGQITNVFGENNAGGNVAGKVTVNIDMNATDACGKASTLDYVYGGGQDASYTPTTPGDYPEVNLVKGVVNHDVFGGGLGESATVTSNPTVNMRPTEKANFTVLGNIYGGGSAAPVNGSTSLTISNGTIGTMGSTSPEGGYVFGGGLGQTAVVSGNTRVQVTDNTDVEKNVYGGGNGGAVEGDTKVVIGE